MAEKIDILGVKVDSVTMAQAVAQVEGYMDERKNVLIATANAEMIMRATHDEELKNILNDAALVVPDGAGTVWAAHHLGHEMPERVAGYDVAQELMRIAASKKQKVFFFGSAPGQRRPKPRLRNFIPALKSSARGMVTLRPKTSRRLSKKSKPRSRICCSLLLACPNRKNGSMRT